MADENNTQQQGAVLTFETLYDYTQRERNETPLQNLSDTFLDDVYTYLKERRAFIEKTKKKADVFGQNQILNMEKQFSNAIRLLRYLLENREQKIIDMALHSVRAHADASDENAMLPHERQLYSAIFTIMSHFQGTILESMMKSVYDEAKTFSRTHTEQALSDFCKRLGITKGAGIEAYEDKTLPEQPREPEHADEDEDTTLEELDPSQDATHQKDTPVSDQDSSTPTSETKAPSGGTNTAQEDRKASTEEKSTASEKEDYTFRDELHQTDNTEETPSSDETKSEKQPVQTPSPEDTTDMTPVTVKLIADVDKFIGLDLEVYGPYSQGETVEVPESIARLLVEREYAVRE